MAKLTYIKSQCRVRCELSKAECLRSELPPADMLERAVKKLDSEVANGDLAFYFLYKEQLNSVWQYLRDGFEEDSSTIAITLAAGAPPIRGVSIKSTWSPWTVCTLDLKIKPSVLKESRFYFIWLTVQKLLQDSGSDKKPSAVSVHDAYLKACEGEPIIGYPIREFSAPGGDKAPPFQFHVDRTTKQISVTIDDIRKITAPVWRQLNEEFLTVVKDAANKHGQDYKVLTKYVRERLLSAQRGIERFGFGMPIELLAAYHSPPSQRTISDQTYKGEEYPYAIAPKNYQPAGKPLRESVIEADSSPAKSKSGFFGTMLGRVFAAEEPDESGPNTGDAKLAYDYSQKGAKDKTNSSDGKGNAQNQSDAAAPGPDQTKASVARTDGKIPIRFDINIARDKMQATIDGFYEQDYTSKSVLDEAVVKEIIKKAGIKAGIVDNFMDDLKRRVAAKEALTGMVVALGTAPVAGANPFLRHLYQSPRSATDLDAVQVDMRSRGHSEIVKEGALIAAVGFNDEQVIGVNVLGEETRPAVPETAARFKAGNNVKRVDLEFFATADGIPKVAGDLVSIEPSYSYEGDVNFASGDLEYSGNVVINGSIDVGATVVVFGNLTVAGEILEAKVFVSGDLDVVGGIITGEKGKVTVKGNLKTKFIDNSRVTSLGNLIVGGNIVNSNVNCGGSLQAKTDSGLIFGGSVRCKGALVCNNMGRSGGDVTTIKVGFDWRWSDAARLRSNRIKELRKLQKSISDEHQRMLTTPVNKKIEDKIKSGLALTEKQLARIEAIIEKANMHLERAKAEISHDESQKIIISQKLSSKVALTIADKDIKVPADFEGVEVTHKARRGTNFSTPDTAEKKAS